MAVARDEHTNNVVIGSGEFFIDLEDSAGKLTGERYVGDSVGGTLSSQTERVTVLSGDGPVAKTLLNKVRSKTHSLSIVLRDMSMENFALLMGVDAPTDSAAVAATAVTDEEHTVMQGRWYQLGRSDKKPFGVPGVAAAGLAVTNSDGSTTYTADTDYKVDADRGRLFIVVGGGIASAAAETIKVDYTPVAALAGATQDVAVTDIKDLRGAIVYLEDSEDGEGRNIYARRCSISASGETALKSRDSEQQITVAAEVLDPGAGVPLIVVEGKPS